MTKTVTFFSLHLGIIWWVTFVRTQFNGITPAVIIKFVFSSFVIGNRIVCNMATAATSIPIYFNIFISVFSLMLMPEAKQVKNLKHSTFLLIRNEMSIIMARLALI